MVSLRYITSKEIIILVELLEVGIAYAAILMPVLITGIILFFGRKIERDKYNAMIEVSKNLKNPSEIKELLEDLKKKKEPIDYRRSGVITLFVGLGLFLFGIFFIDILKGIGLLVGTIGVGSLIAGYLYPNESAEITKAVENFEKR
jgi:dolichol kinase